MTEDELIVLGDYCEDLMKQENFGTIIGLFEKQTVQHFLNTAQHDKEARETVYASFNGVRDLMGLMTSIVEQKNAIIAKENQAPSDDTDALPQDID